MELHNIQLPEFVNGKVVGGVEARRFNSPECRYNITFGRGFLRSAQTKFFFHTNTEDWLGVKLNMKLVDHYMNDDAVDIGQHPRSFYKENIMEMCYLINEEVEYTEMPVNRGLG